MFVLTNILELDSVDCHLGPVGVLGLVAADAVLGLAVLSRADALPAARVRHGAVQDRGDARTNRPPRIHVADTQPSRSDQGRSTKLRQQ